jgi:Ser/Thr protein kinase RdoA (MazF antagonist)
VWPLTRRAYVDHRVDDLEAAFMAGEHAAVAWGLAQPVVLRHGMNVILRCDDVILRVATPTAPASLSIALAQVLRDRGIAVAVPVRDEVVEHAGFSVTAWEHLEPTGQPVDWADVGRMVALVHDTPLDALPEGLPIPSPLDFPWWDHERLLDDVESVIDVGALDGMRATIEQHRGWDDFLADESNVVCHGDVHPGNVIMTASGPVLIDWDLLCVGPRGWDHAPMMTWTQRWGGERGVYEAFAEGYGWSARGDRQSEALADLRLVAATLMRWRVALDNPEARPEAERRLAYWRHDPDAPTWVAQ